MDRKELGELIRAERKNAGLSQKELADKIGVTKTAVSRYEAGGREPGSEMLQKIGEALKNKTAVSDTPIGTAIKQLRKTAGLTQLELAGITGKAVNSIRLYEAGKRTPKVSTIVDIAIACGVDVEIKFVKRDETEVRMPNCKICGEPVVVTPVDHPECRRKKMAELAESVCSYSCKWNTICDDKERLRAVHCSVCGLPKLMGGV